MTQSFDDLKAELLRDTAVRAEYNARAEELEIASVSLSRRGCGPACHRSNPLVEWAFRNRLWPESNRGDTGRAGQRCDATPRQRGRGRWCGWRR